MSRTSIGKPGEDFRKYTHPNSGWKRLQVAKASCLEPTAPDQAWCMDFACDRLENGRMARILAVLDCFTRECLMLKAALDDFQVHYNHRGPHRILKGLAHLRFKETLPTPRGGN